MNWGSPIRTKIGCPRQWWQGRFAYDPIEFIGIGNESIGYSGPGFYFWDETWGNIIGPFPSHHVARAELLDYCENYLLFGEEDNFVGMP